MKSIKKLTQQEKNPKSYLIEYNVSKNGIKDRKTNKENHDNIIYDLFPNGEGYKMAYKEKLWEEEKVEEKVEPQTKQNEKSQIEQNNKQNEDKEKDNNQPVDKEKNKDDKKEKEIEQNMQKKDDNNIANIINKELEKNELTGKEKEDKNANDNDL